MSLWVLGEPGTNLGRMQKGPGQIPGCEQSFRGINFDFIVNTGRAGFPLKVQHWVETWAVASFFSPTIDFDYLGHKKHPKLTYGVAP